LMTVLILHQREWVWVNLNGFPRAGCLRC